MSRGAEDGLLEAILTFVVRPHGNLAIGKLREDVRQLLDASTTEVLLSADTMRKQISRHPDLKPQDYTLIPQTLAAPTIAILQRQRRVVLLMVQERISRLAVKTTEDLQQVFLVSFHFTTVRKAQQLVRNSVLAAGATEGLD